MLSENIRSLRKSKGMSQEELAVQVNVVRQTVSKWEQGQSVPDADLLIALADKLGTTVSTLLGETVEEQIPDDGKVIAEKLEVINRQLAQRNETRRKTLFWMFLLLSAAILLIIALLIGLQSPYLNWNYSDPETAVAGTLFHAFEFFFIRLAPFALVGTVIGAILTGKRR